jgi:hypothetical protein
MLPSGQLLRSYARDTGHQQFLIPDTARDVLATVATASFRIAALASANHNVFYLTNGAAGGANLYVAVKMLGLSVATGATVVTSITPSAYTYRVNAGGTLPTGGTTCTKYTFDSTTTSSASITATCASSADVTASAITWTAPAGTPAWRQFIPRLHTGAGPWHTPWNASIPLLAQDTPVILRPTECIIVQINIAGAANAQEYLVDAVWEEFQLN